MNKDHAIGIGIGLISGAVIGGVIALLYAPKTGKDTRKLIKDKATGVIATFKDKTKEVIDTVKDAAIEASNKGQAAAHALRN